MKKVLLKCLCAIKKLPLIRLACFLIIAICAFSLWSLSSGEMMAEGAMPLKIAFVGEYKVENSDWQPIVEGRHITSTEGDVTLRGKFVFSASDGAVVTDNPQDACLNFYFNHIFAVVKTGEEVVQFETENPYFGDDACGAMWAYYYFPQSEDGFTEIVFSNPHGYGNELAIDQFLENIRADEPASLVNNIAKEYDWYRYVGFAFIAIALVLFGIALVASIIKLTGAQTLWIIGGWIFFTGGFYVLDVIDVFLWNSNALFNTAALVLCQMLSVFFLGAFVTTCLSGVNKKIAFLSHVVLGVFIPVIGVLAAVGLVRIFDVTLWWHIIELVVIMLLFVCAIREMLHAKRGMRFVLGSGLISLFSVVVDFVGIAFGWWETMYSSKLVFGVMFVIIMCSGIYSVINNHKMSIRTKEMEAELKDTSIAVMISQIQPHFLYNSLNSIAELCVVDPKRAEKATIDFSRYLRGNMGALNEKKTIEFEDELNHLKHYIALEKMRYGDDLQFEFDIQTKAFSIPALTVQPLVENAVNHGIRYHKTKGKVKISSKEDEKNFYVTIEDNGVGFDVDAIPNDGKKHVGISNVKHRLVLMCDGKLMIESEKGTGTVVTILIPKEKQK